jgi:hypothetical protein
MNYSAAHASPAALPASCVTYGAWRVTVESSHRERPMKRFLFLFLFVIALATACGRGRTVLAPRPEPRTYFAFSDLDWIRGQYFLLYDPSSGAPLDVRPQDIRVYRDDRNAGNDANTLLGKAVLDPDGALGQSLTPEQASASVAGNFDLLTPGPGADYEILHDLFAFHDTTYLVLRLTRPFPPSGNAALAVSFTAAPIVGPGHALGPSISVGGRVLTTPGPDSGFTLLKLLRVPRMLESPAGGGVTYDPASPWAPVWELELKNIYSLGGYDLDPASFTLTVQQGHNSPPVTGHAGVPFTEMLGLDSWDERSGIAVPGHDGRIDAIGYNVMTRPRIDHANGLLFLPDFRPFAPRLDPPTAVGFDVFLAARVNRRLRLGQPGSPSPSSPDPYSLFNPRATDATWFFTVSYALPAMSETTMR